MTIIVTDVTLIPTFMVYFDVLLMSQVAYTLISFMVYLVTLLLQILYTCIDKCLPNASFIVSWKKLIPVKGVNLINISNFKLEKAHRCKRLCFINA